MRVHAGGKTGLALDVEGLYLRYGPMVLRRCRGVLRDTAAAEDAAQEVFVTALRFQGRLNDEAPGALLLRIATNLCLNRLRSERRRPEDPAGDPEGVQDALVPPPFHLVERGRGAGV